VQSAANPFTLQRAALDDEGWAMADGRSSSSFLRPSSFVLRQDEQTLSLDETLLTGIDYWEVDPAWDGEIFRSAAQAARPRGTRGQGSVAHQLHLPIQNSSRPICVRFVHGSGKLTYLILGN
jgi:hypothetical protein